MSKWGSATLESRERVRRGVNREGHIANALRTQGGLDIRDATDDEDKGHQKIDRWVVRDGKKLGMQIKFRETGEDILFEVFDTFYGWDDPRNKEGRDMIGQAELYACLKDDKRTCYVLPTSVAHRLIRDAVEMIRQYGWTIENERGATFRWTIGGHRIELKKTTDPRDGRPKLMAYIPSAVFAHLESVETYDLKLPKRWAG